MLYHSLFVNERQTPHTLTTYLLKVYQLEQIFEIMYIIYQNGNY
jgi:hypothetical protein